MSGGAGPDGGMGSGDGPSSRGRPQFIDNRDGNTLDRALSSHLRALRDESALPWEVCIASAFFNLSGFDLLAGDLERVRKVRLLLGTDPKPEAEWRPRLPGEPTEPAWTQAQVRDRLARLDEGLRRERDLLPFDGETDAAVRRLLGMLSPGGPIEVRRFSEGFLHAKAYIFRVAGGGSVVGSSNLTFAGLRRSMELNLGHYEDPVVGKVEAWFDELWERSDSFDLAAIYDRLMAEFDPYLIFLRVLYELYGQELVAEREEEAGGEIPVTTFQKHGVWRALRIMRKYGGVLIADGVGLGKTYMAGEIIGRYRERRQRVLLICPAALRDSTWKQFLQEYELFVDCVSYEQLAGDQRLGGDHKTLMYPPDDYALVVIDESHNYRNPDAPKRAAVLRQLLMGRKRDLLLLTATPVNNSLWDLYHLLRYFVKQDAAFADMGVLSMRDRFKEAEREDPFDLSPDVLYPIIDATTVKRTRQFVEKHYANDPLTLPDGTPVPIRFPTPVPSSINYTLDDVLPRFIDEIEEALAPEHGAPLLKMSRYQPGRYRIGAVDEEEERQHRALVGLLRSGLLKRFESSIHAFAKTTEKMAREHDLFLEGLDRGVVIHKELFHELGGADDEDLFEELLEKEGNTEPADEYRVDGLRRDVQADRDLLDGLCRSAQGVTPDDDPKLAALLDELAAIAREAHDEGIDDKDARDKRKVMVFSAFADTIDWIEGFLDRAVEKDTRLRGYAGRIASVAGNKPRKGVNRDQAVRGFAPETAGGVATKPGEEPDRFDILLTTDVLAEGMNLQQCRNIINFDLPWNPMRLVQRHGRIDRINSKHRRVFLRTFFPDDELDRLLDLEVRVRRKLAQAAASVGVEHAPIEHGAQRRIDFAETREEIERLHRNDPTIYKAGGTIKAAQSGEEYRQELRQALKDRADEIRGLPWKAGSGMAKGSRRGHFFCARVGEPGTRCGRVYLRFIPFHRDGEWDGEVLRELGTCLRLIECTQDTERVVPADLKQSAYAAWERARRDIHESWTRETDPANLQPKVPRLNREIAGFLRKHPPRNMDQDRMDRCLDAIESPCSMREQRLLREVFGGEFLSGADKAGAIVQTVKEIGLEPFRAPEPLPPIELDQIHLICWLAIESV